MSIIRMSYIEMCAAAADIAAQSERTQQLLQRVHQAVAALDPHWNGKARSAFDREFAACMVEATHFPHMLAQISTAVVKTAETVRAAEQQAREVIEVTVRTDLVGAAARGGV